MKHRCRQWIGLLLCFVLLIGMLPTGMTAEQIHFHDNEGYEISDHKHDVHPVKESPILSVCEDIFGELLGLFALPVSAAYEDGVACDYCGSWRYDDWKCDNGDHCGEGSGTSCYHAQPARKKRM